MWPIRRDIADLYSRFAGPHATSKPPSKDCGARRARPSSGSCDCGRAIRSNLDSGFAENAEEAVEHRLQMALWSQRRRF